MVPAVNQIEVHPYLCNEEVRATNAELGIITEAWSPIAKGRVLKDPTIGAIASRLGSTPAQVTLRWHIQRGDVIFPKSTAPARMKENFEIFDFELEPEDMAAISALDRGEAGRPGHPDHVVPSVGNRAPPHGEGSERRRFSSASDDDGGGSQKRDARAAHHSRASSASLGRHGRGQELPVRAHAGPR